jgi:2-phospho-L-lactate guanylyltransferase
MIAIVPVKSFRHGKQRLAPLLTPDQRHDLARDLAIHVTTTAERAGMSPMVVTADEEVAVWAKASGHSLLSDPGTGLDNAAAAGVDHVVRSGSPWLILHSDLPLLGADDLQTLAHVVMGGSSVIAPSSDGGTSAIGSTGPFRFSFGPGSFHRHLTRLTTPVIVTRTGLLLDVDIPDDLVAARAIAESARR